MRQWMGGRSRLLIDPSQREGKDSPLSRIRTDPDRSSMPFDDPFAHGEPDSCPWVLLFGVEPLEYDENPFKELRINADSVVFNPESPAVSVFKG